MTPTEIHLRIYRAIIPALDRADRVIWELTAPEPGGRHKETNNDRA